MYDAYRCCTLPKMRMCARTSNIKSTNTERKFTQERKVGQRGCAGLGNVVALRRKWQEALQMIQTSRMHVALSPWAAAHHPARNLKQESQRWSRTNWVRCKNRRRAARSDEVRWPGAREKRCNLLSWVWPGQYHRGRHTRSASRDSSS